MSNFKIGEQVVCIKKGGWRSVGWVTQSHLTDPIYNEIYTISRFWNYKNELYFGIKGLHPHGRWFSGNFRKLDYWFVEEVLAMVMDDQLIKIENPIFKTIPL
jgi:hypothetical protein